MFFGPLGYFGPYGWLLIPGLLLGLYAQFKLTSTYGKYLRVGIRSGLTGAEAAREILDHAGLNDIPVGEIPGELTDHFDPVKRELFLSSENFHGRSLSAVGVAAHETGHALQQQAAYALFNFRMWLVPATRFASMAWIGFFFASLFLPHVLGARFMDIAIAIFSVLTLFQVVTLPVEFDASSRAKQQLMKLGLVQADEGRAVAQVLSAAAMTYVAGMVSSILTLLRLIMIARSERR